MAYAIAMHRNSAEWVALGSTNCALHTSIGTSLRVVFALLIAIFSADQARTQAERTVCCCTVGQLDSIQPTAVRPAACCLTDAGTAAATVSWQQPANCRLAHPAAAAAARVAWAA